MNDDRWREAFGPEGEDELQARVPDAMAAAVWPRLAAELAVRPARPRLAQRTIPALVAALVAFVMISGWLFVENVRLRERPSAARVQPTLVAAGRTVTAGELADRLARLPAETPVLDADAAVRLLQRGHPLMYALLRGPELDAVIADGITAREAMAVLRRLDAQTPIRMGGAPTANARTRS